MKKNEPIEKNSSDFNVSAFLGNESQRLQSLCSYQILDTPPEREFDSLTRLAADICDAPIALISLVDVNRQWFKSRIGLKAIETPRDIAFCAHAIQQRDIFQVQDASKDFRFSENPLVTQEPKIKFYAGAPLIEPDGNVLGTLCVIDRVPRELSLTQQKALKTLSETVVSLIVSRKEKLNQQQQNEAYISLKRRSDLAFKSAHVGIWEWNPNDNSLIWDDGMYSLYGITKSTFSGVYEAWEKGVHPDDREKSTKLVQEAARGEKKFDTEFRVVWPSGEVRWIKAFGELKKNEEGKIISLVGVNWDITAERNIALLLECITDSQNEFIGGASSKVVFNKLLDSLLKLTSSEYGFLGEVLYTKDNEPFLRTHAITDIAWNDETRAMFNKYKDSGLEFYNMNTLFGRVITSKEYLISNDPYHDPRRGGLPVGHPKMNSFLGIPILRGDVILGMIGIANSPKGYDVHVKEFLKPFISTCSNLLSSLRVNEKSIELEKAKDSAVKENEFKSAFLANMSHEIRTPMNGIIGMTNLLKSSNLNQQAREYVETINHSCEILLGLVNDILDLSKLEAGKVSLERERFSVAQVVDSVFDLYADLADGKSIVLQTYFQRGVPQFMLGDALRIQQILSNLVSNAIKFTETGSIRMQVSIYDSKLRIAVVDTGIGIKPEVIRTLFQRFSQADSSTTKKFGGTGLGLAISKNLATLMGGDLSVESNLEKGSTFTLELPVDSSAEFSDEPLDLLKNTFVIVSKNKIIKEYLQSILKENGVSVSQIVFSDPADTPEKSFSSQSIFLVDVEDDFVARDSFIEELAIRLQVKKSQLCLLASRLKLPNIDLEEVYCIKKPVKQTEVFNVIKAIVEGKKQVKQNTKLNQSVRFLSESGRDPHVLVAEDNVVNQTVLTRMLERHGCNVSCVANGIEAVEAVQNRNFDLVLMDCFMPEMDGYQATQKIRQLDADKKGVPIIAVTASVLPGEIEKCKRIGMNGYVAKPIQIEELLATISNHIQSKKPRVVEAQMSVPALIGKSVLNKQTVVKLSGISGLEGDALFRELLQLYFETSFEVYQSLSEAIMKSEDKRVIQAAHKLKGMSNNIGAERVAELCEAFEASNPKMEPGYLGNLFKEFHIEFFSLIKEIQRCLQEC